MGMKLRLIGSWCLWVSLVAVVVLPLAGCGENAKPVVKSAKEIGPDPMEQAGLDFYWDRQLNLALNERVTAVRLLDENIYFLTNQKHLIAMDARSGVTKWRLPVTYTSEKVYPPIHFDGMRLPKKVGTVDDITNPPAQDTLPQFDAVVINTLTKVMIINRETGQIIRDIPFKGFSATNQGCTDGLRYFVAGSDEQIYAIMLLPAVTIWTEDLGERVVAPLICADEKLYVGSTSGLFHCFYAENNNVMQWKIRLDEINTPFAIAGGNAYIASQDGRVYALDGRFGQELWQPVDTKGSPAGPVLIAESSIYTYASDDGLTSINLVNGTFNWNIPEGRNVLAVMDDNVYAVDSSRNLLVANVVTGKVSQTIPLKEYKHFATNIKAPAIYAATPTGKVCCIRKSDAARLTPEMLR